MLDEIPYKYFKRYHNDDDVEVEIYHTNDEDDRPAYCTVVFEFKLEYDASKGSLPIIFTKRFKSKRTYNTSSEFAYFMTTLQDDEESDYDESSDEDDESLGVPVYQETDESSDEDDESLGVPVYQETDESSDDNE